MLGICNYIDPKNVGISHNDLTIGGNIYSIPKGTIVMWYGNNIPDGWIVCDGYNGTPDLRGRVVICAGQGINLTQRNIGDMGGEETHALNINEIPEHSHKISALHEHWQSFSGSKGEDHPLKNCLGNQTINTDSCGNNTPHNNMQPFYVLSYLMKI